MIPLPRSAAALFFALGVAGCQTASLEDAAPRAAPQPASSTATPAAQADAAAAQDGQGVTVVRRNPGFTSPIPIEKTAPVEKKAFVDSGARRTGTYPLIGTTPEAANAQMSAAEKLAAEAEIAELLKQRAATPSARAEYEARLQELRALAASHGSDTQQQIEN